jgi:transposase-like protein
LYLLTNRDTPLLNIKETGRYEREQEERDKVRRKLDREFKNDAVRLVELSNRSVKQVAKELDI